ncbi:hypothetical protein PZA11_002552 [Diplocarpon coronariae]
MSFIKNSHKRVVSDSPKPDAGARSSLAEKHFGTASRVFGFNTPLVQAPSMATPIPLRLPWRAMGKAPLRRHYATEETANILNSSSQVERQQWVDESLGDKAAATSAEIQDSTSAPTVDTLRLPRAVQATYLRPLRRTPTYGVPTCDLQMRSYSIRNLEFFSDFALRAAYYLGLPAYGPVPLPRIVERWTVPRGNFIHKKSQENFERRTVRRLIQIRDGEAEAQELWLAFLRKHAYYGIGMKANVWEFAGVGVGKDMDAQVESLRGELERTLGDFAFKKNSETSKKPIEVINRENFRAATGGNAPMTQRIP